MKQRSGVMMGLISIYKVLQDREIWALMWFIWIFTRHSPPHGGGGPGSGPVGCKMHLTVPSDIRITEKDGMLTFERKMEKYRTC